MDIKDKGSNLVPGQGRPLTLDQLRKLAGNPAATGGTGAARPAPEAAAAGRTRRFRRAPRAWAGALAFGAALSAASAIGASLFLDRGPGIPASAAFAPGARPAAPDAGLSAAERERYWAIAALEPGLFPALLGIPGDDPGFRERNARHPGRLLSDAARPGPETR